MSLNRAIKKLFFTTSKLNMTLHLTYITSKENEADVPSRCLTTLDCKLHPKSHTCDLMALDSNAMTDQDGSLLPHFYAPPVAAILWCQFLCARSIKWSPVSGVPLRFPASLSDGSCSAFSEIPRAVVHGHSLGCLSEEVLVASSPKLCQ